MKDKLRKVAPWLAALLFAGCAFVCVSAYRTYRKAEEMLGQFKELGFANNPTMQFDAMRRKNGTRLRFLGCRRDLCQYEIELSNEPVAALRVVPYTEMKIWFTVYRGVLQAAMLDYRTALRAANSPVVHIEQGVGSWGTGFDVNPHGTTREMWNGLVELNSRASIEQRDAALALNLTCFVRLGGCKDIVDLMPSMWARTGSGEISSRLVGLSQKLEESHGLPSPAVGSR